MAATLTQERFSSPEWVFERKFDGIRLLAFKNGTDVRLLSRNQLPQELPAVAQAVAALPAGNMILDGEMTWRSSDPRFHIFDIMWLDGQDLRSLPLERRREILEKIPLQSPLARVERLDAARPWEQACAEGWEGVIAKRQGSLYEPRRSPAWLKMKCEVTGHFVVGGFTDPQGARVGLGALLVGHFKGDDLLFAGKVGTGFDSKMLRELRERLSSDRDRRCALHPGNRSAAHSRSLGSAGHRRGGRIYRVDGSRQAAASEISSIDPVD